MESAKRSDMRKLNKHQAGKIKFALIKSITSKIHAIVFPKPIPYETYKQRFTKSI